MKKLMQVVLMMGMILAVLSVLSQDCPATSKSSDLLTIRIDKAGCVWWHEMRVSLENLPKPLFVDVDSCADSGCCLDYPACYAVLEDYIGSYNLGSYGSPHIVVIVHPEAHYMHFENFLTVVDDIEAARVRRIDSLIAIKEELHEVATGDENMQLYNELLSLDSKRNAASPVVLGWWTGRDDRIFQIMADSFSISGPRGRYVPPEHQFLQYYESGHWSERFPDSLNMTRMISRQVPTY